MKPFVPADSRVKQWMPPPLRRLANRVLGSAIVYRGPHRDFAAARDATASYQDATILRRVREATVQVLAGQARYEQDGSCFSTEPPASLALSALLLAAASSKGRLSVVDFGGSLASHYLRWLPILAQVPDLHWCVVEQPHFVAAGKELFALDNRVTFEREVDAASLRSPNAVLVSSVLQYLEDPRRSLEELVGMNAKVLIVDRHPVSSDHKHWIVTQHVPRKYGAASYPLHLFPADWTGDVLDERYRLLCEWSSADSPVRAGRITANYRGSAWIARD